MKEVPVKSLLRRFLALFSLILFAAAMPSPQPVLIQASASAHAAQESWQDARTRLAADCDHSNLESCVRLALLYEKGGGGTIDYRRAADLYQRACVGGNATACDNLGFMYFTAKGVTVDDRRA